MKIGVLLPALSVIALAACGPRTGASVRPGALPAVVDAPYELADDLDLDEVRDEYDAMPPDDPARQATRTRLAQEYARRIDRALRSTEDYIDAHEALLALASLWSPEELREAGSDPGLSLAAQLEPYAGHARRIRDVFARSGGDSEVVAALLFLALAEPSSRDGSYAEMEQIFAYADDLANAEHGPGARHSRPIAMLEDIVETIPYPEAVDRLLALYVARQRSLEDHFRREGASLDIVRAHGEGAFKTVEKMVRLLARANRLADAPAALAPVTGLGDNSELRKALARAFGPDARDTDFITVGALLVEGAAKESEDSRQAKQRDALAVYREGMKRFPASAEVAAAAGISARKLEHVPLAIRLFEHAEKCEPMNRSVAAELADLYRVRVTTLTYMERPASALERLRELEAFHARVAKRWPRRPLESDLADAYAAMGRGMISLGRLAESERYLSKSLAIRPTFGALEQLGTIALKQDRFGTARDVFARALKLPVRSSLDAYNRARILRLMGDALAGSGQRMAAIGRWGETIDEWMSLAGTLELPPAYKGELLIEAGKTQWALNDQATALKAFEAAIDLDPDGADTHSNVVSFLLLRDQYRSALDAFHRALGSREISDYSKVYMSLWVLTEARRAGHQPDPLALAFLQGKDGQLWHHQLARFATGRATLESLGERARTRAHRAELLYYSAVLGQAPAQEIRRLLSEVVATDMVLFYEYEMAKYWLANGFAPAMPAP